MHAMLGTQGSSSHRLVRTVLGSRMSSEWTAAAAAPLPHAVRDGMPQPRA